LKKPSKSRDSRFGFFSYADVISPRKTDYTNAISKSNIRNGACCPHLDDAAPTPDAGNACVIQMPTELFRSLTHEHEALCIRDNFRGVESLLQVIDKLFLVTAERLLLWSGDNLARAGTLCLNGG
jgi:hypothetical protein